MQNLEKILTENNPILVDAIMSKKREETSIFLNEILQDFLSRDDYKILQELKKIEGEKELIFKILQTYIKNYISQNEEILHLKKGEIPLQETNKKTLSSSLEEFARFLSEPSIYYIITS